MTVQRKTITVSQQQNLWIKSQVKTGNFNNDSEYIRDLIRKDVEYKNKLEILRTALIAGKNSGISSRSMSEILNDAKSRHSINV
jgi:antitoxin ParD1/3/4